MAAGMDASMITSLGTWRLVIPLLESTIARAGRPLRLSWRGQAYLEAVKTRWYWMKDSKFGQDWSPSLAAGLFGYAVLSGTELSPLNDMFRRANTSNWGGDGGGCGGGGCGGGSGGCGGGGCGGCGG